MTIRTPLVQIKRNEETHSQVEQESARYFDEKADWNKFTGPHHTSFLDDTVRKVKESEFILFEILKTLTLADKCRLQY